MDFLNIVNESEDEFKSISKILFNEYAIKTYNFIYRITELEFYWNSSGHIDKSTYERNHVDPKSGDWFFHYSGVDIALKSETTGGYGGILLRSIFDITNNKPFKGPQICAMRLFSGTNAFADTIKTQIIQHSFPEAEIKNGQRIRLGKNAIDNEAYKLHYRFFITPIY